jgi:hypothetical protein
MDSRLVAKSAGIRVAATMDLIAIGPSTLDTARSACQPDLGKYIVRQQIVEILNVLAASAEEQVKHLDGLNLPGYEKPVGEDLRNIDELALGFGDAILSHVTMQQRNELTDMQVKCLLHLDELLKSMSGSSNAQLWTIQALYSRSEWQAVRVAAAACLVLFQNRLH